MAEVVDLPPPSGEDHTSFSLPLWLGQDQKVMCLKDSSYHKGCMLYDSPQTMWHFSCSHHNRVECWGVDLLEFILTFQGYIVDGTLVPGWHNAMKFLQGLARHVSVLISKLPCPSSLHLGLKNMPPDHVIWKSSYREEYSHLKEHHTFDIISADEYCNLC